MDDSLLVLTVLATCVTMACSAAPIEYVVKDFGGTLEMNCTKEKISDATPSHWVLNDLTALNENNGNAVYELEHGGLQLRILKVEEHVIGDFFCVLQGETQNGSTTWLYFKSVVKKYEKSTWDEYRTQTIVGVVAALITVVVMVGLCLVYRYRWRAEEPDKVVVVNGGYDTADAIHREKELEREKGFINESFASGNPTPTHGVITDDTQF